MLIVKHFRPRSFLFGILLGLLFTACSPVSEPVTTPRPRVTEVKPTVTVTPTEQTTDKATATAESPPPAMAEPAFESLGPLPVRQEIAFDIVDQWGGTPQSLALEGATAYVGFGPRLFVLDVSDPAAPQLLGQSEPLSDLIRGVDVAGDLAYLAAGSAGLVVLDASDPAMLRVVNDGPNYAGDQPANAHSITINGSSAFLVDYNRNDGQTTLHRFDISDAEQVALVDIHSLPADASVQVTEELIIVIGAGGLQLRDAAKPDSIMSRTRLAAGDYTSRAVIQDDIVIVAECCAPSGIERFDISDPYHPAVQGGLQEVELMPPSHAATEGSLLVTASIFGEFGYCQSTVNLVKVGEEGTEALASLDPENCLNDLTLDGDALYLTGRSGLQIYDVSDASNPVLLGQYRHPAGIHDIQGLARRDGLTYALNAEGRRFELTTLDLSQPPPGMALERQSLGQGVLLDLFVGGDALIVPVWMGGLYTLDISDPAAPRLIHRPVEGEVYPGDLFTVVLKDETLYTPVIHDDSVAGIGALDISDPANPTLAGTVETGAQQILNLTLGDDTLYALSRNEESRITLYDVGQPLAPEQIAALTMPEFVSRLAVVGDTLYATCDFHNCQSVYAVDVSDKQNPDITTRWTIPFGVRDMVTDDQGTIYLNTSEQRIWSMDSSDPAQLRLTGVQQLPGEFAKLKIEGNQMYAATYDGGLYQIQVKR